MFTNDTARHYCLQLNNVLYANATMTRLMNGTIDYITKYKSGTNSYTFNTSADSGFGYALQSASTTHYVTRACEGGTISATAHGYCAP
jgi:hypothetical protein